MSKVNINKLHAEEKLAKLNNQLLTGVAGATMMAILITVYYGFYQAVIVFLIVALVVFCRYILYRSKVSRELEQWKYLNQAQLRECSGGNLDIEADIFKRFVTSYWEDYGALNDALAEGNMDVAKLKAHSIKGAALTVGLDEVAEHYRKVEMSATDKQIESTKALVPDAHNAFLATVKAFQSYMCTQSRLPHRMA